MNTKSFSLLILSICISLHCQANKDSLTKWKNYIDTTTNKKTKEYGRCFYKIGQWFSHNESKLDSSVFYLKKAKKFFEDNGPRRSVGTSSYTIGVAYSHQGDRKNAIKYLTIAENIFIEVKDTAVMFHASLARADQLPSKQKIDRLKEIATLAKAHGTIGAEISCYGNIANGYFNMEEYDSTISYAIKQYDLNNFNNNKRTDYKRKTAEHNHFTCEILGDAYLKKKNYADACRYFNKSYRHAKSVDAKFRGIASAAAKIIIAMDIWENENQKQFKQLKPNVNTLSLLREANQVANNSKSYHGESTVIKGFLSYFKKQNNKDSIIYYQNKLLEVNNKVFNEEQAEAGAKFSEELKTADKEKEIIKLNADKKIASATANRNKIIFFLILLGLLSSIYFIVKRIKDKNLKEQEERDKNFRSKLSSDLHDDVGTILTSLSMQSELLETKASEDNKGTVSKIAGMSRDATRRMRDTVWAIDSRKDNIMDLSYRMIDFAEDILGAKEVEFQLEHNIEGKDDKISAELRQNIFLIFKETITNAAKYGSGDLVTASLNKENDKLSLMVSNQTGSTVNLEVVSGLGLSNIQERTETLNGKFKVDSENNSFITQLSFPL